MNSLLRALTLGGLLLVASGSPALAQHRIRRLSTNGAWDAYVAAFDDYAEHDSVVGASTVLVREGRVVAREDRGFADRALERPVDERTIFHWASITKTLTAVAIMQLRDRGLVSLDDPVTKWAPELRRIHDPFGPIDDVTLRMLLSHTAGFQNPTWPYGDGESWQPFEPTEWSQLVAMMPYQAIRFRPGSRFAYSNPGFIYLARVIESVTGDSWESYVQKNIWTPLGMSRSYVGSTPYHLAVDRSNRYAVVAENGGPVRVIANGGDFNPGITIPNSGWNAPVADLVRWTAFLTGTAPGVDAGAVLAHTTVGEMWRPVLEIPAADVPIDEAGADAVGLSFFRYGGSGGALIGHTGDQGGYRSFLFINPRTRDAVIGVVNTSNEVAADSSAQGWARVYDAARALIAR